ncbi:MAG: BspA family leucine-rich repeat surface protein [Candidatus Heimdallarchaeota archaeon]|nr:BspA family leucine-rich repeat surface protein [Candidatus Heimdallarchaeota archaeon]
MRYSLIVTLLLISSMIYLEPSFSAEISVDTFVSVWNTEELSVGSSPSKHIKLPLIFNGSYNFYVDWGDGQSETVINGNAEHSYTSPGIYTVTIDGILIGWSFNNGGDRLKILEISQWGGIRMGNNGGFFFGCENLELTATDSLDLSETSNMFAAFHGCSNLGSTGQLNLWDVSNVTDMRYMFASSITFNQDLSSWKVSNVTDMEGMFANSIQFNQDLSSWDISSVNDMSSMFFNNYLFNQDLSSWDVSRVTDMSWMFFNASSFNQDLSSWNVSSVTDMSGMFFNASSFNQDLSSWDVSRVTDMSWMFFNASSFNQDLSSWNVSSVTDMHDIFKGNSALSIINYDKLLEGWSQLSLQTGVIFDTEAKYTNSMARQSIIDNFSWIINDMGLAILPSEPVILIIEHVQSQIRLLWSEPKISGNVAILGYNVYRSINNETFIMLSTVITLNFTDNTVHLGNLYSYKITATTECGESNYSSILSLMITISDELNFSLSENTNIDSIFSSTGISPIESIFSIILKIVGLLVIGFLFIFIKRSQTLESKVIHQKIKNLFKRMIFIPGFLWNGLVRIKKTFISLIRKIVGIDDLGEDIDLLLSKYDTGKKI